jgi:hypothetical protein
LCESLFGYWTARQFEGLRDRPEHLAELLIDASRMWESTIDTLICCMASLDAAQVRQVYWTVLHRSFPSADYGRVLYMLVHSVAATGDVELLVDCLERFRRLTDVATKEESAAAKPKLLFCLSRIDMARAVLASMHRPLVPTVGRLRERLVRLLFDFPMMDGARLVIRSPFEFFLAFALITPYGLFLGTGIVIAFFFFIVPIMALVLLAGAPHDPYGLIRRCRGQLPTNACRAVARRRFFLGLLAPRRTLQLGLGVGACSAAIYPPIRNRSEHSAQRTRRRRSLASRKAARRLLVHPGRPIWPAG